MNTNEMLDFIQTALFGWDDSDNSSENVIQSIETFEDYKMLTMDKGLVVTLTNKKRFSITLREMN